MLLCIGLTSGCKETLKRMDEEGIIDEIYGDNVLTQFGVIKIPMWIWVLLMLLTIMFLAIYSINRHRYSQKLKQANEQLQKAYSQLTVARSLARRLGGDVVLDTHCTGCTRFVATLAI